MQTARRPLGVSILAILAGIGFVVGLVGLLGGIAGSPALLIFGLILAVLGGASMYGLWNLRPWAWTLALVLYVFATLDAVRLLVTGTLNTNLVIGPLVIIYLLRPEIRRAFGR